MVQAGNIFLQIGSRLDNAMAFQPAPNCVQVVFSWTQDGIPVSNTLHLEKSTGYSQVDLDALTSDLDAFVASDMVDLMGSATVYNQVEARGLSSAIDLISVNNTSAGAFGPGAAPLPNNVTKAITLRTGFTGRSARGRWFQLALDGTQIADTNTILQVSVDNIIEMLEALKLLVEALGWIIVIVSRWNNGVKRATALTTPVVGFGTSDLTLDSMRSRLS